MNSSRDQRLALSSICSYEGFLGLLNNNDPDQLKWGLQKFITFLETKNTEFHDSGKQILLQYVTGSPKCEELFLILRETFGGVKTCAQVLKVLSFIVQYSERNIYQMIYFRATTVHRKLLQQLLGCDDMLMAQSVVYFLLSIVRTRNVTICRRIAEGFNFQNPGFTKLITSYKKENNTKGNKINFNGRQLCIELICGFFELEDGVITETILGINKFVTVMLKGLSWDRLSNIKRVLNCLETYVLLHSNVSDRSRSHFFNEYTLDRLIMVYNTSSSAADMVHSFMCTLIKNSKNIKQKHRHKGTKLTLLHIIKRLQPNKDFRQQQLVLLVLKKISRFNHPFSSTNKLGLRPSIINSLAL